MTLTTPLWIVAGICVLAVAGFCALFVLAADALERVRYWLRDRVTPLLEDCDHEYTPNEAGTYEWCQKCDSVRPTLLELPPERTWEQMTSHQLPAAGMSREERKHWRKLEKARTVRAAVAEVQHRAAYEAMGFDYPSGLMERVRELTP